MGVRLQHSAAIEPWRNPLNLPPGGRLMYGTVAKLRVKPGMEQQLQSIQDTYDPAKVSGYVMTLVYRMDNEPDTYYLATVFESKESYIANADSPEQNQRYLQMMEMMAAEPEWHDGEIVSEDMPKR